MFDQTEKVYIVAEEGKKEIELARSRIWILFMIWAGLWVVPSILVTKYVSLWSLMSFLIFLGIFYVINLIAKKIVDRRLLNRQLKIDDSSIECILGKNSRRIYWEGVREVIANRDDQGKLRVMYIISAKNALRIDYFENLEEIYESLKSRLNSNVVIKDRKSFVYNPKNFWIICVAFFVFTFLVGFLFENFGQSKVKDVIWSLLYVFLGWLLILSKFVRGFYLGRAMRWIHILLGACFIYSGVFYSLFLLNDLSVTSKPYVCPLTKERYDNINDYKNIEMAKSEFNVQDIQITRYTFNGKTILNDNSQPAKISSTENVEGRFGNFFGFYYQVKDKIKVGEHIPLLHQYIHPPLTNPLTGEVKTIEEFPQRIYSYSNKNHNITWHFEYEWEIVPGPWTLKVIYKDKVLAEKTFMVTPVDDMYAKATGMAKIIPQMKRNIAQNLQDAEQVNKLGHIYRDMGDYDSAIVQYRKAMEINPHPNYYNNICLTYNNKKQYDSALEACNIALQINPQHTTAFINRGDAFRGLKDYQKSIMDYQQSLKIVSAGDSYNPPFAYQGLCQSYMMLGETDLAWDNCQKALQVNFDSKQVKSSLKMLKRELSFSKRLRLLYENKIFVALTGMALGFGLFLVFVPAKLAVDYLKDPKLISEQAKNDAQHKEKEIRQIKRKGLWLVFFVLIVILYKLDYIRLSFTN